MVLAKAGNQLQVLVIEDEPLYRDMLNCSLSLSAEFAVWGAFNSGEEAIKAVETRLRNDATDSIHAAVIDFQLPGEWNGLQTAYRLRSLMRGVGILILSNHRLPAILSHLDAFEHRGFAYLLKTAVSDLDSLKRAIIGIANGEIVADRALLNAGQEPKGLLAKLTERQKEILHLTAQGYSNAAIAEQLFLSHRTVENHLSRIYQVIGIDSHSNIQPRVAAALAYLAELFPMQLGHLKNPALTGLQP